MIKNILGWLGALAILTAYFLITFGYITTASFLYLGLNLFGSIFVFIETFSKKDYQPFVLNLIWAVVALIGILRFFHGN